MKRRVFWFSFSLCLAMIGVFAIGQGARGQERIAPFQPPDGLVMTDTVPARIYPSRQQQYGIVSTEHQAIFGANSCVAFGDPFSSWLDPQAEMFRYTWRGVADERTYRYLIKIPSDYPDDMVRVEIFDADSRNKDNNVAGGYEDLVVHTQLAIDAGFPAAETLRCNGSREDPCLINTNEYGALGAPIDDVNLWWFARVDEARGAGTAPGDGRCGQPMYTETYNTITHFELSYMQDAGDGSLIRTPLAFYYGQSGDFVTSRNGYLRDFSFSNYDHDTDLRWVTPGGQSSVDQAVVVPAGCGSPNGGDYVAGMCDFGTPAGPGNGFEIELASDLAKAIIDADGNRYIQLDITSLSGSAENGFEIWAGPDDYINSYASNVNTRNVQAIDEGFGHDSLGIEIFAIGQNLLNSNIDFSQDIALTDIGAEYAGQAVYMSLYDTDSGAEPPIIFYFDSVPEADWSLTFSVPGVDDPDGVPAGTRCIIGNCWTQFIEPPYRLDIPTHVPLGCTPQQEGCTPFPGGRLMARYGGGLFDTYMWHIEIPADPAGSAITSVAISGPTTGMITNTHLFTATTTPLTATLPITYTWQATDQATLTQTNSLTDTISYSWNSTGAKTILITADNGLGAPVTATHTLTIVQPSLSVSPNCATGPDIDLVLTGSNWVDSSLPILLYWIEEGQPPTLREILPAGHPSVINRLWTILNVPNGTHTVRAISGDITLDAPVQVPCNGQPVLSVELDGPTTGLTNAPYPFIATSGPMTATQPLTYVWEATDLAPITQTNGLTDTITFTWLTPGEKTVTVTVYNGIGAPVTVSLVVQVEMRLWLPIVLKQP